MDQQEILHELCTAAENVFSTMLGLEVKAQEPVTEAAVPGPTEGVVSLVGITGTWAGTGSLSCSADMARKLSGQFLMCEFEAVNEDVLDAMAELTNMIVGGFKTAMEEKVGAMSISIPTVIFGRNFTTRTLSTNDWTRVPFLCCHGDFDIHICLAPSDKAQRHPRAGKVTVPDAQRGRLTR